MMGKRRKGREHALQILYEADLRHCGPETVIHSFWESLETTGDARSFAENLALGVWKNLGELDRLISTYATNWRVERMSAIDRNILRIGTYELLFEKETDPKVILNEAIEIAKRFGTEESGSFINGVLDKIARR